MNYQKVTVDQLNYKERLHLSILHAVKQICRIVEESITPKISFDRDAEALIGELVWKKLQEMGLDLEHFAKHAKRTTIKPTDVLLVVRRNPSLTEHLKLLVKVQDRVKKKHDDTCAIAATHESISESTHPFARADNMKRGEKEIFDPEDGSESD